MHKYKMIMKKILSALGIIVICLCSCNNNITNPELDEPKNETKTETPNTNSTLDNEKSNCLLNISPINTGYSSVEDLVLNSLTIKDENGKVVGSGDYWGSYYVPYDGTLTINWKHRGGHADFVTSEYTFNVKSAHQLDFVVSNTYSYCSIIVGADILYGDNGAGIASGSVIASFAH